MADAATTPTTTSSTGGVLRLARPKAAAVLHSGGSLQRHPGVLLGVRGSGMDRSDGGGCRWLQRRDRRMGTGAEQR